MCLGRPAIFGRDAGPLQLRRQQALHFFDIQFAVAALLGERLLDLLVFRRVRLPEGQVFQLPFQRPDAEPVGQWCVQFLDLQHDLAAPGRGFLAAVTGAYQFLGKPCDHQARVAHHGEQHLAQCFGLPGGKRLARRPLRIEIEVAKTAEIVGQFQRGTAQLRALRRRQCRDIRFCLPCHMQHGRRSQRRVAGQAQQFIPDLARPFQRRGGVTCRFQHRRPADGRAICSAGLRC